MTDPKGTNSSTGRLGVIRPEKRQEPQGPYRRNYVVDEQFFRRLASDPDFHNRVVAESHGANSGRRGVAMHKAAHIPLLNANQDAIERDFLRVPAAQSTHAKDRMVRRVVVEAASTKAAKYNDGWGARRWGIYSLKYARGVVIVDHKGRETKTVFPSIGKALEAIRAVDMEIVK